MSETVGSVLLHGAWLGKVNIFEMELEQWDRFTDCLSIQIKVISKKK